MKITLGLLAAVVLCGVSFSAGAQTPQGSYLSSCTNVRMEGGSLTAMCRRADGREQRTALRDFNQCIGDIGNDNGVLRCNRGQAPAAGRGQATAPGYAKLRLLDLAKAKLQDTAKRRLRDIRVEITRLCPPLRGSIGSLEACGPLMRRASPAASLTAARIRPRSGPSGG